MNFNRLIACSIFLISGTAFADTAPTSQTQDWKSGKALANTYTPSYNMPATIDVCPNSGMDFFADASITYWLAEEDGLMLGFSAVASADASPNGANSANPHFISQTSGFKPGFKVGVGLIANHEWELKGEYTWYRAINKTKASSISGSIPFYATSVGTGSGVWFPAPWFAESGVYGTDFTTTWKLGIDLADATMSRPYYQGRHLVLSPFAGLRGAWIRQALIFELNQSPLSLTEPLYPQPTQAVTHSTSWAVGPRLGFDGKVLLCHGFQLEASAAGSLLYTRYTSIVHDEAPTTTDRLPFHTEIKNLGAIRPAVEMGLGLGWSDYLCDGDYYLSLSADYDFNLFFSQNTLRMLMDDLYAGGGSSPGNLTLQGLTVKARFDF